jgi:glycosyltransferase involved in cell wall biosynthesis
MVQTMSYRVLCFTDCSDLPETELFIRLKNAGVDIEVASNPAGPHFQRLTASEVPVHEMVIASRFSLKSIRDIRSLLSTKKYDILYCFNNKAISNLLPATRKNPYRIITYRGIVGNVGILSPASWTTHLHPRISRIICVCHAVRDHLVNMRFAGWRLSPEKVVTIYKGHDPSWYQRPPADLTSEFGLPANAFVVGFAGRDRPRKGLADIIDATRCLPPDMPVYFLLLGRLEKNKRLQRQIAASPFRDRIYLTGFRKDAPSVFAACDTFLLPSREREGLARAVIEAMAGHTPPIVTNAGGLSELVTHHESGLVIPIRNPRAIARAIVALYQNPAEKRRLGNNAEKRIRTHFHINDTVRQTAAVFEDLMTKPPL